jgi:succinoglycan biosynthesis protein ExoO
MGRVSDRPAAREQVDVSVIIAAWRAADVIERAIAAALASIGVSLEVIVVDDASPDQTYQTVRRLYAADARVRVERLPENSGPSGARNRALELAIGRYIAVLDADDAMAPERLSALVRLADSTQADIVADNMMEVDETGRPIGPRPFLKSSTFAAKRFIDLETWVAFNQPIGGGDCLGYLKPLFRRTKLAELGATYDPGLRNSEDYYLVADLLAAGAVMTFSPEAGYLYTRSTSSTSHRLKPDQTRAWLAAEQRFRTKFEARLTGPERLALARRARMLRNVDQLIAVTDAVKTRKVGVFLGLITSDLRASAFTVGMFAKIAAGKALGRKFV